LWASICSMYYDSPASDIAAHRMLPSKAATPLILQVL
jgi:hypothetical protein